MAEAPIRPFKDRSEAGRILGEQVRRALSEQAVAVSGERPVVLALPRGGVPVGFEVAQALHAELDVCLVRKLGMPGQEELALGAIASGGVRFLNRELIEHLRVRESTLDEIVCREEAVLEAREQLYREGRPPLPIQNKVVVLVDDGLATGASMLAAVRACRSREAGQVIVAVPVGAPEACETLRSEADQVLCAAAPRHFRAVGAWYEDFSQVTDLEVRSLLQRAALQYAATTGLRPSDPPT